MLNPMLPDRQMFAKDPGGYSRSAWMRWAMLAASHGLEVDPFATPTTIDLKNPVLWLAHAEALTQAAVTVLKREPAFENMPIDMRGICDTQYCAVGLMLVGYSLEVCLKAMIIIKDGAEAYAKVERDYRHHDLQKLADFVPRLNAKNMATLNLLTHFIYWTGRYPDPGLDLGKHEQIFSISEDNEITARHVFETATKVIAHVQMMVAEAG